MGFYTAKTAKAYDKLAANYLAFIQLASIRLSLKGAKAGDMRLHSEFSKPSRRSATTALMVLG
jgi:hypothetical protein